MARGISAPPRSVALLTAGMAFFLWAMPSAAQEVATLPAADGTLEWRYDGYFGGIPIADITYTIDLKEQGYATRMNMISRGFMGLFGDIQANLKSEGALQGPTPRPRDFERAWTRGDTTGIVNIRTDAASNVSQGFEDGEPTDVDPSQLQGVVDPLAALLAVRQAVLDKRSGTVSLPVFDGKRRLDVTATISEAKKTELNRTPVQAIPVEADMDPIAGFSERQDKGWRATKLHLLFTPDERAVPLQIRFDTPFGVAVMNLECGAILPCSD